MLAHANNHTFDYGSSAILETIEHAEKAGLVLAGSGADLQQARSPRYIKRNGFVVGLVAMASSFIPYGAASRSLPHLHGRPGLNPLTLNKNTVWTIVVPPHVAERIRGFGRLAGRDPAKLAGRSFWLGARFRVGDSFGIEKERELAENDRDANLMAISDAAKQADIVVASIHAHRQGRWLREFAGDAISHGADIVFVHGPHEVRGIEMRQKKPIFYSMGDFVFEFANIDKHPAEAYERAGLGEDASPQDVSASARAGGSLLLKNRKAFEGFTATISIVEKRISRIRLLPVDLHFDGPDDRLGRPHLASPTTGKRIIETVAGLSERYRTAIRYDAKTNSGEVEIL
jgi:Bacterial capsule synthesis protein PGA_cap